MVFVRAMLPLRLFVRLLRFRLVEFRLLVLGRAFRMQGESRVRIFFRRQCVGAFVLVFRRLVLVMTSRLAMMTERSLVVCARIVKSNDFFRLLLFDRRLIRMRLRVVFALAFALALRLALIWIPALWHVVA